MTGFSKVKGEAALKSSIAVNVTELLIDRST